MSDQEMVMVTLHAGSVQRAAENRFKDEHTLEDKARICFEQAFDGNNTWMVAGPNHDLRFRIGVGALMLHFPVDTETHQRIIRTIDVLRGINVASSGIPVDIAALIPDDPDDLVPLMKIFHKVLAARA